MNGNITFSYTLKSEKISKKNRAIKNTSLTISLSTGLLGNKKYHYKHHDNNKLEGIATASCLSFWIGVCSKI